ncbi:hypothetical protein B0H14DRAFT_644266, partial [Mycena olivaceomarginata]
LFAPSSNPRRPRIGFAGLLRVLRRCRRPWGRRRSRNRLRYTGVVGAVPRGRGEVACRYRVGAYAGACMDTTCAERLQPRLVRPSTRAPHIHRRRRPRRKGGHRLGCSQTRRLRAGSVPAVAACARQGGRGRIYGGGWDAVWCGCGVREVRAVRRECGISQIPQSDPFTPATPVSPSHKLPSSKRRARSSDPPMDDDRGKSKTRDRTRSTTRHDRAPSMAPPPPPLPSLDRSRSVGPRPRTAPPRGDVYGVQQPGPGATPFYPVPVQQQMPYYPHAPGYGMPAPPYPYPQQQPTQNHHTRSRSPDAHTRAPADAHAQLQRAAAAPAAAAGARELVPVRPGVPPAPLRQRTPAGVPAAAPAATTAADLHVHRPAAARADAGADVDAGPGGAAAKKGVWVRDGEESRGEWEE